MVDIICPSPSDFGRGGATLCGPTHILVVNRNCEKMHSSWPIIIIGKVLGGAQTLILHLYIEASFLANHLCDT